MTSLPHIVTQDGTILARCPHTGAIASGRTLDEAAAELRRLIIAKEAA